MNTSSQEEKARRDESELFVYGICSTEVYQDYRENVDYKVKCLMVDLAQFYEKNLGLDTDHVNDLLFKQYKEFWTRSEPHFQKLYEQIQDILKVPDTSVSHLLPEEAFNIPEVKKLENKIEEVQEEYIIESCYLHQLNERLNVVQKLGEMVTKLKINEGRQSALNSVEKLCDMEKKMMEIPLENIDTKFAESCVKTGDASKMLQHILNDLNEK